VYSVGPVPMMKAVADITRGKSIRTIVSVNPLMVDATGMCGVCRCRVNGQTVFGCVDGPEFDAHALDFDDLERRLRFFSQEEQDAKSRLTARKQS
jgi:ferredoxin--NADP+ reductase